MPGRGNAARSHQLKLFLAFTLLAACVIAFNALPSMASVKAERIPTKTVLSYSASTGTKAIFTAKVSPSVVTGSVLFIQGPPPRSDSIGSRLPGPRRRQAAALAQRNTKGLSTIRGGLYGVIALGA
jgi:hypothetical protein